METVEQMDERRARAIFEWGIDFPKWEEHKFQQSGFYLKSLQQAKDVRASDASAGLVAVPVELLERVRGHLDEWESLCFAGSGKDGAETKTLKELRAILRAAQGELKHG